MRGSTITGREALLVGIVLAVVLAAPAQAGTVEFVNQELVFQAAPGETNDLEMTAQGGDVIVADLGAPLSALGLCVSVDLNTASCPLGLPGRRVVVLGDGDDEASLNVWSRVLAGEGDDTVTAGGDVRGGPGNDTLATHGVLIGSLNGGAGNDTLRAGAEPILTRMDGGPGSDTFVAIGTAYVTYEGRTNPVAVDADGNADDGEAGEGDNVLPSSVTGGVVELLIGGSGDDRLSTIGGVRAILGGPGNDVLDARFAKQFSSAYGQAGDDEIFGGAPNDRLDGGHGDDLLVGRGGSDWMKGGPGDDVLKGGRGRDKMYGDHDWRDIGRGEDLLIGGPGSDLARGGMGADTFLMRDPRGARDRIDGGPGRDRAHIDRGLDRIFDVEILF